MNIRRASALLLCLLLSLSLLVSCKQTSPDPNEGKPNGGSEKTAPETIPEYLDAMADAMTGCIYKLTTTTVSTGDVSEETVTVAHCSGRDFALFASPTDTQPALIYRDGVLYATATHKKITLTPKAAKELLSFSGFDEDWFASFCYKEQTLREESGTVVIHGTSADTTAAGFIGTITGAMSSDVPMSVDNGSMESSVTLAREDCRLLEQRYSYDAEIMGATTVSYHTTVTQVYEYGDGYAVSAPADGADYTAVSDAALLLS